MIPSIVDDGSTSNPQDAFVPEDPWVAYHGTSSPFSPNIEANGLDPDLTAWTAEHCRAVLALFKKLDWSGTGDIKRAPGIAIDKLRAVELTKDVRWLEAENKALQVLFERPRDIVRHHEPVVYAVRLDPT